MLKLGIIVLNYNNYEQTIECVDMIKEFNTLNKLIVIVDNASQHNDFEKLQERYNSFDDVACIKSEKNGGYAYGNNLGIDYLKNNGCELVCILNNDVVIEEATLKVLIKHLIANKNVGVVAPVIVNEVDGTIQSTGGSYNYYTGKNQLVNYGKDLKKLDSLPDKRINFVSGACMVFPINTIEIAGKIPEAYFLYFEETEWCKHILDQGLKIKCLWNTKVTHKNGETTKKIGGLTHYFMTRNVLVFENRNATLLQKISFYCILVIKTIYRLRYGAHTLKDLKIYFDAITNKNRYDYLQ